eukprot:CCRYP_012280-RA/>CCRYP_012280-RA protein AED:0.23 eAED:0.31 QI:0/0/0.25/1/0/0.25/4/311/266
MGTEPPSCSCTISPRIPIIAARPLLSSIARFDSLCPSQSQGLRYGSHQQTLPPRDILHHCKLKEANKCKDLESSCNRNLQGASPTFSDVRELGSIVRNVTRKTEASAGGDLSKESKLADTSVLQLNITEAHGRICQLAFLGQITTRAGFRLPGDISYDGTKFSDIGEGWAGSLQVPVAGALQILAFVGFLELAVMKDVTGEGEFVGDFRNGALDFGWDTFDEETKLSKRAIELNNGRAAMMGILGLMVHEQLGGSVPISIVEKENF